MRAPLSIFVLEDEALIRMMIVQILEELGHRVVFEAGNIREAMALATTADFDLALLDVNVGGDTSNDVAAIVDRRGLLVLFVSGYTSTGLPPPFGERRLVLQKPFREYDLKRAIEQLLAR
jgi:CheY-like chemotaxis protein